eukprot:CAMPEP_0174924444 /NCGR_PEP_ID=MMETSP1355-20121228/7253_1 /TAXON_ID=464990 /ORGANISM="Hemiselmis tepida, Strain CCMP443" /LENGTH=50 /DNA_ID=CAMNT_0016170251 /DNA_START=1135 /DNA_END=1287 /DNA_ORIENTATION=+
MEAAATLLGATSTAHAFRRTNGCECSHWVRAKLASDEYLRAIALRFGWGG